MGSGKCVYDAAQTPAHRQRRKWFQRVLYEANASGRSRQGAPDRKTQKIPLRTRRSFTRGTPRGLFEHRLDGNLFIIGEFVAHDSSPQFRSLNQGGLAEATLLARPLRAEADINLPTVPAETVENDPLPTSRRPVADQQGKRTALSGDGQGDCRRNPARSGAKSPQPNLGRGAQSCRKV